MLSSQIVWILYQHPKTVFTLSEVAILTGETATTSLAAKLNYQVRQGRLLNIRKGLYAKPGYRIEEAAGGLYTPSYLSLEYVLQRCGVVFQYDARITMVSYLNRTIEIDSHEIVYHGVKGEILAALEGIEIRDTMSIATPERAFLDLIYLEGNYYFDNLRPLRRRLIWQLLPLYANKAMERRVSHILEGKEE